MAERARPEVAGEEGQQQKRLRGVEGSGSTTNQGGSAGGGTTPSDPRTVFIGGILPDSTPDDLRNFLAQFGEVVECKVVTDMYTGRNKGYAFVTFAEQAVSDSLKGQGEVDWSGRRLNIGAAVRGAGALKDDLDKKVREGKREDLNSGVERRIHFFRGEGLWLNLIAGVCWRTTIHGELRCG